MSTQATVEKWLFLCKCEVSTPLLFSVGADPRLYNEDPRPADIELRESLEMVVEDD
jgi:hypothetical protein